VNLTLDHWLYLSLVLLSSAAGFHFSKRLGTSFLKALLLLSTVLVALFLMMIILFPDPGRGDESAIVVLLNPNFVFKRDWNLGLSVALTFFSTTGLVRAWLMKE
jgi:hypothetical protein